MNFNRISAGLGLSVFSVISFGQTANPFLAADPGSFLGARSQGRAGATAASSLGIDSLFQNPASSAYDKNYSVGFNYGVAGDSMTVGIVDTQSGPVGAGIYYSRKDFQNANFDLLGSGFGNLSRQEESAGFSLATLASPDLSIGTLVRWSYLKSFEPSVLSGKSWNFDLGAIYKFRPDFSMGITGQNFLRDSQGFRPRKFILGAEFTPTVGMKLSAQGQNVSLRSAAATSTFVLPNTSETWGYSLGGEYRFAEGPILRLGYEDLKAWNQKALSLGAGFEDKSFAVEYALRAPVLETVGEPLHLISVTGFF